MWTRGSRSVPFPSESRATRSRQLLAAYPVIAGSLHEGVPRFDSNGHVPFARSIGAHCDIRCAARDRPRILKAEEQAIIGGIKWNGAGTLYEHRKGQRRIQN